MHGLRKGRGKFFLMQSWKSPGFLSVKEWEPWFVGRRRSTRRHGVGLWSDCTFHCRSVTPENRLWSFSCRDSPTVSTLTSSLPSVTEQKVWRRASLHVQIQEFAKGGGPVSHLPFFSPFTFPYLSPSPLPLELVPFKPAGGSGERCKLPQWGPGQSSGQKRILCALMLSESSWLQSFWIFWVPCFTVKRSKFSIS